MMFRHCKACGFLYGLRLRCRFRLDRFSDLHRLCRSGFLCRGFRSSLLFFGFAVRVPDHHRFLLGSGLGCLTFSGHFIRIYSPYEPHRSLGYLGSSRSVVCQIPLHGSAHLNSSESLSFQFLLFGVLFFLFGLRKSVKVSIKFIIVLRIEGLILVCACSIRLEILFKVVEFLFQFFQRDDSAVLGRQSEIVLAGRFGLVCLDLCIVHLLMLNGGAEIDLLRSHGSAGISSLHYRTPVKAGFVFGSHAFREAVKVPVHLGL